MTFGGVMQEWSLFFFSSFWTNTQLLVILHLSMKHVFRVAAVIMMLKKLIKCKLYQQKYLHVSVLK